MFSFVKAHWGKVLVAVAFGMAAEAATDFGYSVFQKAKRLLSGGK